MGAAGAGVALTAVGGIYSARNTIEQGKAQNEYYKYLAKETELQADAAEKAGQDTSYFAQDVGAQETKELKAKQKEFAGTQRVAIAASGLSGVTAEDLIRDSVSKERMDELAIRYNADLKSYESIKNANAEARALRQQAGQYRYAGISSMAGANIQAGGTLLSTAGQTALSIAKMNNGRERG